MMSLKTGQKGMKQFKSYANLKDAFLCSSGLMVFSFFIHYDFPLKLVSVAALIFCAYIFSRYLKSFSDLLKAIGESPYTKKTLLYCFSAVLLGIILSIFYRWYLGVCFLPKSLHDFMIVAALIGCTEELVFRGFIQEQVRGFGAPFAILYSTLSHTGYKCCLFLSPAITHDINIGFLALWTFIAGILLGALKHYSKSILPPIIAHVLFDILVYSEFVNAPWWVW